MSTNHIKKRENQVGGSNWEREREREREGWCVTCGGGWWRRRWIEKDRLKRETKQFDVINYIKCFCGCFSFAASLCNRVCVFLWCNKCVFRWRWWSVVDTLPPFFSFIHYFPPSWIYRASWPLHSFDDDTRKFQFFRFRYNNHLPLHTHIRSTHTCVTITTAAAAFVH